MNPMIYNQFAISRHISINNANVIFNNGSQTTLHDSGEINATEELSCAISK